MALKPELEALLKVMDPADAEVQRKIFEKHPQLGDGWLRQADYDRSMNENKTKLQTADKWKEWADRNVVEVDGKHMSRDAVTLRAELEAAERTKAELERKVAESVVAHGGDAADVEKVTAAVLAKIGGEPASKTEIARLVGEETTKAVSAGLKAAQTEFFEKTFAPSVNWMTGMTQVQYDYRDEFGKNLPRADFAKFMKDNNLSDPTLAFEQFVAPDREKKRIAEAADKLYQDRVKEEEKKGTFPGSSGAPTPVGGLQLRLNKKADDDPLFGKTVELGDGSVAAAAAADLRNEGKI
jgi:hypothetical protein